MVGSDVDLSAYRTSALQDIIDNRHTAGVLLARQEASTADEKAIAAQEDADDALAALDDKQATLTALTEVPGLQAALDAKQATPVPIGDVTGLQASLDALAPSTIVDPAIEPSYWVDINDARIFTVHFDSRALALDGATKVRLVIQGNPVTVNIAAEQHTYNFAFDATASANISRARRVGQTVRTDFYVLNAADAILYHVIGFIRVLATAPDTAPELPIVYENAIGGRTTFSINWARLEELPAGNFTARETWLFGWEIKINNNSAADGIRIGLYNKDGTRDRELVQPSFPDGAIEYTGTAIMPISAGNGNIQLRVTSTTADTRNADDRHFWAIKLADA